MPAPTVVFDEVSKKFRRGQRHDALRDLIPALAGRWFRDSRPPDLGNDEFWALRNVSFEVHPGEALGIVGPNGAGKSTSLKVATRILRPDLGHVAVRGRVGALIEVAAGFHPDLTGRENVYLQGALMGMRRADVATRLDEIVDFAGVGPFLDTPIKRFSSGMNARLGFSIAAHLEPDVLFIDEVLSVGDMSFQERCVDRMLEFKRRGVAMVFVSHNLQAVSKLCERSLFIRNEVGAYGRTSEVLRTYLDSGASSQTLSEDMDLVAHRLEAEGGAADHVEPGTRMRLGIGLRPTRDWQDLTFGLVVRRSTDMLVVYDGNFTLDDVGLDRMVEAASYQLEFEFSANLVRGLYHVAFHVFHNPSQSFILRASLVGSFSVDEYRSWAGVADLAVSARLAVDGPGHASDPPN